MGDADSNRAGEQDRERDAALLTDAVRAAGALALSMFGTDLKRWTKGASSPVSEADIAVSELLETSLRSATADYGFLSEESLDDQSRFSRRFVWVVDPIDGTRAYLAGRDDWCVSVALLEETQPVLGAVFAPVREKFFFARRGRGALCNERRIAAACGSGLDSPRVAGPEWLLERFRLVAPGAIQCPRLGSLALRFCQVAEGAVDVAFASAKSQDWDLAAADLIVREANGIITELSADPVVYNGRDTGHGVLVAAARERHARIVLDLRNGAVP